MIQTYRHKTTTPQSASTYKYWIGIDCGVNTGFTVWNKEQKELALVDSFSIINAINKVEAIAKEFPGQVFVRFEDARLRKWIPRQKTEGAERGRREGAGSVKRDCSIWEEFLKENNIPYEAVAPKNNKTKLKAEAFRKLTGWTGETNEHSRDAGMLVFGF